MVTATQDEDKDYCGQCKYADLPLNTIRCSSCDDFKLFEEAEVQAGPFLAVGDCA